MRREKTNYTIQSVSHALDVLEQDSDPPASELGVPEPSKRPKLHKTNVFRLLATHESRGYIEQNRTTDNYRLGIRCLQLGQVYVANAGFLTQARPVLTELARQARETVYVAMLRRGAMVPVEVVESERPVRIASPLGVPLPLHCTAAGKAYLAFEGEDEIRTLVSDRLKKFTERTPAARAVLLQQLRQVAASGVAIDMGEYVEDLRAVAVPVRDYARAVVGTLAVAGPAYRFQAERIDKELAPLVVKAGRDLSSRLGFDAGKREAS